MAIPMNPNHQLGFLVSLLLITSSSLSQPQPAPDPKPDTVYDILPEFGLPGGLLPDSVTSYSLSPDGRFAVFLKKPCYVQFEYLVYYEDQIIGKLNYGSITELEGIQVQRFFVWFDVNEIRVDLPPADSIYFQVGFINKKLDMDQFMTIHSCQDRVSGSCHEPSKHVMEFPASITETPMLETQ